MISAREAMSTESKDVYVVERFLIVWVDSAIKEILEISCFFSFCFIVSIGVEV